MKPERIVSLPARQQRELHRIEETLAADDPRLRSMFSIFTRLTQQEAMPGTERVRTSLRRPPRRATVIPIALIAVLAVLVLGLLVPSPSMCRVPPAASRYSQSINQMAACQPAGAKPRATSRARSIDHPGK